METPSRLAKAPDGNGGVYLSLDKSGCLSKMIEAGVECLDVYCVDNILAKWVLGRGLIDELRVGSLIASFSDKAFTTSSSASSVPLGDSLFPPCPFFMPPSTS